mmetsp:Transcript_34294/g.67520  ORF Transcript_34294/g.67520 Transcript_34294/m.67520 type:complete len:1579 (+) Transcript_34294:43-4779(+)|eukprot:CAMPEP_0175124986 /NCGR_PEP_ID=MMETSP0087-20121206/3074_1 /TAXON_ID=136419 /ORGANISM="Unknown Unknown, Strain D1" /LENGTH=1578 /DNA_ID=CAMNT_0016406791 /DNA_START=43 /DNA_END=4779 /DNA_ORIENTATION=-
MHRANHSSPLLQHDYYNLDVHGNGEVDPSDGVNSEPEKAFATFSHDSEDENASSFSFGIKMSFPNGTSQLQANKLASDYLQAHGKLAYDNVLKALRHEQVNSERDRKKAIETLHYRSSEGYACWAEKNDLDLHVIKSSNINVKFAQVLLFRVVSSLAEHVLYCPERLAQAIHDILTNVDHKRSVMYIIDLRKLLLNISRVHECKEKYIINFDDINQRAAVNATADKKQPKTYYESEGGLVLIDIMRNYHPIFFLKMWIFAAVLLVRMYVDDDSEIHPELFLKRVAQVDSSAFLAVQLTLFIYSVFVQERGQPCDSRSWFHVFGLALAVFGLMWVWIPDLFFPSKDTSYTILYVMYFLVGRFLFSMTYEAVLPRQAGRGHRVRYGRIASARHAMREQIRRGGKKQLVLTQFQAMEEDYQYSRAESCSHRCYKTLCSPCRNLLVYNYEMLFFWLLMLALTAVFEYFVVSPIGVSLTYNKLCQVECEASASAWYDNYKCNSCVLSLAATYVLMAVTSICDLFILFNMVLSCWGYQKGLKLGLHNTFDEGRWKIDFREARDRQAEGKERRALQSLFGSWKRGVDVWNCVVQDMYLRDNIGKYELNRLFCRHDDHFELDTFSVANLPSLTVESRDRLMSWLKSLSALSSAVDVSADLDNHSFLESMPSLSQMIVIYEEDVMKGEGYLKEKKNGGCTNLEHLINKYPKEWVNFERRMRSGGLYSDGLPLLQHFLTQTNVAHSLVQEIRLWASFRTQTVARTIRGALTYHKALEMRFGWLREEGKVIDTGLSDMVELVIAAQVYSKKGDAKLKGKRDDLNYLLKRFKQYPISIVYDFQFDNKMTPWDEEVVDVEQYWSRNHAHSQGSPVPFEYATCVKTMVGDTLELVAVVPRQFRLRIGEGGYCTQGKAANHLNAIRKLWGHVTQVMDANMDAFMGEAFKVPYVTHGFVFRDKEGKTDRKNVQYRIIGFREYIYTHPLGLVGQAMASSEQAFGSIFQRVLNDPLGVRMHYGHPDFFDTFFVLNRGGLSKASARINLSEDIFAGYNTFLRKEVIHHVDHLEWQKGRETVFTSASAFLFKITSGAIAMMRTRDMRDLNLGLGVLTRLSLFCGGAGYYFNQWLLSTSLYLYLFIFFFLTLTGSNFELDLTHLRSTLSSEWVLGFGFSSALPLLAELVLSRKLRAGLWKFGSEYFPTTLFYLFQNQMVAFAVTEGVLTGEAAYQNTGRPAFFESYAKTLVYKSYVRSHFRPAISLFLLFAYILLEGKASVSLWLVFAVGLMWLACPVLFCPQAGSWGLFRSDSSSFASFLLNFHVFGPDWERQGKDDKEGEARGKNSFFGFWESVERSQHSPDALVTTFVCTCFLAVQAGVLLLCVPSDLTTTMKQVFLYVCVLLGHLALSIVWFPLRRFRLVGIVWVLAPLVLVVLMPHILAQSYLPSPTFDTASHHLLALLLFYFFTTIVYRTLLMLCAVFARIQRTDNKKSFTYSAYNKAVSTLYCLSLLHHINVYSAVFVFTVQLLAQLALVVTTSAVSVCWGSGRSDAVTQAHHDNPQDVQRGPQIQQLLLHRGEAADSPSFPVSRGKANVQA